MSHAKSKAWRRPEWSIAILAAGGVAYLFACIPSINARGYPPLDPFWAAMRFLWVAPLALSALFDSWRFKARWWQLVAYSLATGWVDAATETLMVPRSVDPLGTAVMTIFFYGPVHFVVSLLVEATLQGILGIGRDLVEPSTVESLPLRPQFSLLTWFVVFTIVCASIGFPFAMSSFVKGDSRSRGRRQAEKDWKAQCAVIYSRDAPQSFRHRGAELSYEFDRRTGLPLKHVFGDHGFRAAYNQRIQQLLHSQGNPPWTMKAKLPPPEILVDLLTSRELAEVTSIPHDVTTNIVVFRKGTITRWGSTSSSEDDSLSIATPEGMLGIGGGVLPIFVGPYPGDADLVCIRNGNSWVGVFHRDGRHIASVSR